MLVAAIVSLVVAMLVATTLVQAVVVHRRQARGELQNLQAFWLADSGYRFAIAKLRVDPDYAGSRWPVRLGESDTAQDGVVEIKVETVPSREGQRRVDVTAHWPDDPVHRSSFHKSGLISLVPMEIDNDAN